MFSPRGFSHKRNWYGVLGLRIYKPLGTKYHHRSKLEVSNEFWQDQRWITAISMFRSLDMVRVRISLFSDSITIHNQLNSDLTLIKLSSTTYSEILSLADTILWGLYFLSTSIFLANKRWLILILCKNKRALAAFLVDKPRKYK